MVVITLILEILGILLDLYKIYDWYYTKKLNED
jgi:hypothetical protein